MEFIDMRHDMDSCMDVWVNFYCKTYPSFFGAFFDFSKIEDNETSEKCKRWYIKLRDDIEQKKFFPKFKMAGDCIFNFNQKKVEILRKYLTENKNRELLLECAERHHSYENFAFMPITGGMNNQKGQQKLDRPDIHVNEINKYFNNENSTIFNNARGNAQALKWYLSLFENDIMKYIREVYLIDDEKFIFDVFLPFANTVVCNEETAVEYMKLAKAFWEKRKITVG